MDESLSTVLYAFSTYILRKGLEFNPRPVMYNLAIRKCTSPFLLGHKVENFQIKIYYPAKDRTPDLLNLRQTCYHLSQHGKRTKRNSEPENLNISHAIKLLLETRNELREFISNVETAVHPTKYSVFLKCIQSNTTGDPKTKLLERSARNTKDQVKSMLEENYIVRRTNDFFPCKMFNSKQVVVVRFTV